MTAAFRPDLGRKDLGRPVGCGFVGVLVCWSVGVLDTLRDGKL